MKVALRLLGICCLAVWSFIGCNGFGHVGRIGSFSRSAVDVMETVGEVEYIDARARRIEIKTDSGRTSILRYDDRTETLYRQRHYSPDNLERGDYIVARIQQGPASRSYTDRITVRESAQERFPSRRHADGRLERIDGRVESIDPRRGSFQLRDSRDRLIVVSVPFNAPRPLIDNFNRLREGDLVEVEERRVGPRFEVESFLSTS